MDCAQKSPVIYIPNNVNDSRECYIYMGCVVYAKENTSKDFT